ncbi:MAG: hypothetical protein KDA41_11825, partial [Planctomycetales bacterium]|nr:hypothetical protein [Planctomycetales bacterium]
AAAHPGTIRAGTALWVTPHLIGACLGATLIAFCFYREHANMALNFAIIGRIVARVKEVRQAKGLDDDAPQEAEESAAAH